MYKRDCILGTDFAVIFAATITIVYTQNKLCAWFLALVCTCTQSYIHDT